MGHKQCKSSLVFKPPSQSFSAVTSLGFKEKHLVILQMTLLFMLSLHGTLASSNEEMFWGSVLATMTENNRDFQLFPCSCPVIDMCLQGPADLKNDAYLELGVISVVQIFFFLRYWGGDIALAD